MKIPKHIIPAVIFSLIAIAYSATVNFSPKPEIVFIEPTVSEENILDTLKERGFIKNKMTYYTVWFMTEFFKKPEAGGYAIPRGLNALALYNAITNPDYKYVAIEEGLRKEQIIQKFASKLNWDENSVEQIASQTPACLYYGREGYMAPGTYLISASSSVQDVQKIMQEKFQENFEKKIQKQTDSVLGQDEIVKVASLIQREAAGKRDMRLISGIIWNRIMKEMPLQIDATLQYAKGNEEKWWPRVKPEDKFIDSPYNTYQIAGLPPTPIANPGEEAIKAAMDPLKTSCMFYLHDKYGTIHCSTNYKEHLSNIKRYL